MALDRPLQKVTMNKYGLAVGAAVMIVAIGLASFREGRIAGEDHAREVFFREAYLVSSLNAVASYASYSEISEQISKSETGKAKCSANILASANLRLVRACLTDRRCHDTVIDEVRRQAPGLLVEGHPRVTYFENRNSCWPADPDKR